MAGTPYIWQEGKWHEVPPAEPAGAQPQQFPVDASSGPQTVLVTGTFVEISKTDETANPVTIQPPEGVTVCDQPTLQLAQQGEAARLRRIGNNYFRA